MVDEPDEGAQSASPDREVVNPRLSDVFGVGFTQEDVSFAIPHLREDLPLHLDPFLLWKSEKPEYQVLHEQLLAFLEQVRVLERKGDRTRALSLLLDCSEAAELGLGYGAGTKRGNAIGPKLGAEILDSFSLIPQLQGSSLTHVEILSLVVPLVAEDRISDIVASVLKRYFIEFTKSQADALSIPTKTFHIPTVWDSSKAQWSPASVELPFNPLDESPVLLAPLDMLRHLPWINYDDYYKSSYARFVLPPNQRSRRISKATVLEFNRRNFSAVEGYVQTKESQADLCTPDPLFRPLQLSTLKKKVAALRALPSGRDRGQDKKYEDLVNDLLTSLLYPELDFAADQVRTISGAHIRDIIFYNDGKTTLLQDLRDRYAARQIVFELKNTASLSGEHVNQLYRYLDDEIGRFGILVTRNRTPRAVERNIVDLHSSKRCAILTFDDTDLELMVNLLESGRRPVEALKKRFVEFTRSLPK